MPRCSTFDSEEQLSKGHEDLFASQSCRLEDFPRLCTASSSTKFHHRYHSSTERLWWLYQIPNELQGSESSYLENIRWLSMVASKHSIQPAQWTQGAPIRRCWSKR